MPLLTNLLTVCMISGSFEYESEKSLAAFQKYLEAHEKVKTVMIVYKNEDDNPSLAPIENADVVLLFTRRLRTKGEEFERFKTYCAKGKPIVGVRTASHAYQNWLDFDKLILGGNYHGHFDKGPPIHATINLARQDHPILKGVHDLDSTASLYKNDPLAVDTTLLLTGKMKDATEPLAWTRMNNGGRVFYTSLGDQTDFQNETFLRLLANAVLWAAGKL